MSLSLSEPLNTALSGLAKHLRERSAHVSFESEVCLPVVVSYRKEPEGFFEVTHVRFTDPLPCIQGKLAWSNLPGKVMEQLEDEARKAASEGVSVDEIEGEIESFISLPVRVTYLAATLEFYSVVFVGVSGLIGRFLWEQLPEREEQALRVEIQQHASEE